MLNHRVVLHAIDAMLLDGVAMAARHRSTEPARRPVWRRWREFSESAVVHNPAKWYTKPSLISASTGAARLPHLPASELAWSSKEPDALVDFTQTTTIRESLGKGSCFNHFLRNRASLMGSVDATCVYTLRVMFTSPLTPVVVLAPQ